MSGKAGEFSPPRARDRTAATQFRLTNEDWQRWWLDVKERVQRRMGLAPDSWVWRLVPYPELLASLVFPGGGHLVLGHFGLGILFMAVTAGFIGMLIMLARDPGHPDTTGHIFWMGLAMGAIHMHAMALAARRRGPEAPRPVMGAVLLLVAVAMYGQIHLLGWAIYGRNYQARIAGVRFYGQGFFRPYVESGDLLQVNPVTEGDLKRGELVQIQTNLLERALGLAGDRLDIRGKEILRNGQKLPTSLTSLIEPGFTGGVDEVWQMQPRTQQTLTVGPGEVGFLFWGRELRTARIASLPGRIDAILAPEARRCRFVDGVIVPIR